MSTTLATVMERAFNEFVSFFLHCEHNVMCKCFCMDLYGLRNVQTE